MYNPITLAHYFVRKSIETNTPITPYKVEFMVYFAHGWNLAIDNRALIDEDVKAWRHGPVIVSINKFYSKSKEKIQKTVDELALNDIKLMHREFLDGIWSYYSHLNEVEMVSLCLEPGTPWYVTYEKSSKELTIEPQKIKQHYKLLHISNPEFCDLDDPISIAS